MDNVKIDYQKVFNTLDYLIDCSVNEHSYSELRRHAFRSMAYKYKQAISSFASGSKYFEQDRKSFNEWEDNLTDDELLRFHCHFYCPWMDDEFIEQTEADEDGNYSMLWKEHSWKGDLYRTHHNLFD